MHDMSNTRKEIAARLGFAAGSGAKVSFERYEIGDAFKFEDKIYVINSHANEINAVLSSADSNAKKALSLADFAHSKWLQFEGKAKSSRPGTKAKFDLTGMELYSRIVPTINILGRFVEVQAPRFKQNIADAAKYAKKAFDLGEKIFQSNTASPQALREFERQVSVAKALPGWRIANSENFSRPGAKAEFAAHPSWSEGILGKDTDPKLAAYSWISKNNIESGRKQMLLADLAAGMYEKNPSMSIAQAVLAAAKDMVSKGVATRDIQQWAENGGKFARPGAKAAFGRAEDVYRLLETTPGSYANYKKRDALVTEAMRLADITPAGKDVSLHELAEMVGQDLEADRSRMSRPGAKTRMTREQTEEQKAGLKIMSAADPAVGAKIATLIKEGKPQDQAVAIALDMKRRGEL